MVLTAGCAPPSDRGREVEDGLGRTVSLADSVSRVVTLAPSLTETIFAAGAGHKLVGVGRPDDYPSQIDSLPRYSTYPIDFEAVAALDPDLALASDQVNGVRDADMLESLGIPTYFFSSSSLDEILHGIEEMGRLLGTERAAEQTADSLRDRIAALKARTQTIENRPLTLFLIGQETLFSFGSESYMHDLIELAGGRSATGDVEAEAPILSEEFVLAMKPEVIIGPWGNDMEAARLLELHPTWSILPAVRNGRIYGVDPDIVQRPGPRLVQGAWAMARKLHPELFDSL